MSFRGITPPGQMFSIDSQTRVVFEDVFRQTSEIPKDIENVKSYIDDVKKELNNKLDEILSAIDGWKTVLYPDEDEYLLGNSAGEKIIKSSGYKAGHDSGDLPVSDGTVNTDLNADDVDGYGIDNTGFVDGDLLQIDETGKVIKSLGKSESELSVADSAALGGTAAALYALLSDLAGYIALPSVLGSEVVLYNAVLKTTTFSFDVLIEPTDYSAATDRTGVMKIYDVQFILRATENGGASHTVTATWHLCAGTVDSTAGAKVGYHSITYPSAQNLISSFRLLLSAGRYKLNLVISGTYSAGGTYTTVKYREKTLALTY